MGDFIICLGLMGLQASFVIIVVFAIRAVFNIVHIPRRYITFLWMVPFFFLVFPWKITSPAGFWNKAPASYNIENLEQYIKKGYNRAEAEKDRVAIKLGGKEEITVNLNKKTGDIKNKEIIIILLGTVWGTGTAVLFIYSFVSYFRLKRKVLCSVKSDGNIYYADDIQVPMVFGYIKPRIYIPSGTRNRYARYAIEHERTHIRRKDFITKPVIYFIVCLHWFNPLVWLAYSFMAKDMEIACDEETLQRIGAENKKGYADALVNLFIGERNIFTAPCAFGNRNMKERIKNILHYKKTARIMSVIAAVAGILIAVFFMTEKEEAVLQGKVKADSPDFGIEKWMDIELPEPYSISTYQPDTGWGGGFYIFPLSYHLAGESLEYTPVEWTVSGSAGKIPNSDGEFLFKDGKINEGSSIPHHNHSMMEQVKVLDCTGEWQVLMALWDFDLYTAGNSAKNAEESISRYWYFYFVKENEPEAYYLALSAKEFSKDEAIQIAQTVKIK